MGDQIFISILLFGFNYILDKHNSPFGKGVCLRLSREGLGF